MPNDLLPNRPTIRNLDKTLRRARRPAPTSSLNQGTVGQSACDPDYSSDLFVRQAICVSAAAAWINYEYPNVLLSLFFFFFF